MSGNPLFSRRICSGSPDRLFSRSIDADTSLLFKHPRLTKLPHWPNETIALLCTVAEEPHAIPVTAPLRISDRKILLSLKDCCGSLARLRKYPQVAILILGEGDLAFTARGRAFVVQETMEHAPGAVAVAIEVEVIDDHRLTGRRIVSGASIDWSNDSTQRQLSVHFEALWEVARESGFIDTKGLDGIADPRKMVGQGVRG